MNFFKNIFCKHEYIFRTKKEWYTYDEEIYICKKCGKVKKTKY